VKGWQTGRGGLCDGLGILYDHGELLATRIHFLYVQKHQLDHLSKSPSWRRRTFPEAALPYARLALLCLSSNIILHVLVCLLCTFRLQLIFIRVHICPSLDTVAACSSTFCTCCPRLVASKAIFVEPHRRRSSAPCTHHHHSSLSARTKGPISPPTLPAPSRPTHYSKVSWSSKEEAVHEPRCCYEPLRPSRPLLRCERHRACRSYHFSTRLALLVSTSRRHQYSRGCYNA
jgi:hypothetical protein